jgi:hypothetical protein
LFFDGGTMVTELRLMPPLIHISRD